MIAVKFGGDWETVRALLDKGADVNARDDGGATALMWATERTYLPIVHAFLEKHPDVNAKDNNGSTAIMWVVESNWGDGEQR